MKEALKLILEAMTSRVKSEKSYDIEYVNKAKEIAKERMIKAIEEL